MDSDVYALIATVVVMIMFGIFSAFGVEPIWSIGGVLVYLGYANLWKES